MAWIESHQKLRDEPKLFDLMVEMGWTKREAIGALHLFWWWCVDHAETGDLSRYNNTHIALVVEIDPTNADKFVAAMIKAGFLERTPSFRIANWWKYCRRFMQQRYKDNREKWELIESLYKRDNTDTATDSVTGTATQETNQPNQQNKQTEPTTDFSALCQAHLNSWNEFCAKFPILSKIREITPERRAKLRKRFERKSFRDFDQVLTAISEQNFLLGVNNREWVVSFDWLITNDTNHVKVLERRYLQRNSESESQKKQREVMQKLGMRG